MDNTSGQGKGSPVPEGVKGLGWGAFLWSWLWGLFNRVWLSLLFFVPVLGIAVPFVLLFKGREWAWQNKTWESVEHFNKVQRKWAIAGFVLLALSLGLGLLGIMMGVTLSDGPGTQAEMSMPPSKPAAPAPRPAPAAAAPAPSAPASTPAPSTSAPAAPAPAAADSKAAPVASAAATVPAAAPALVVAVSPSLPAATAAPARMAAAATAGPKGEAPAPRPRVRREPPMATASVAQPEPKIHTPRYNDLMTAVLKPDHKGVTELLDLGRWIDKPDGTGTTPLIAAVRNRDTPMVELLLSRGANVNATASNGFSALGMARSNGDSAMATLLQRSGAR